MSQARQDACLCPNPKPTSTKHQFTAEIKQKKQKCKDCGRLSQLKFQLQAEMHDANNMADKMFDMGEETEEGLGNGKNPTQDELI
ncbi:hypothetical protein RhiTH_009604 [Rhizoctonia solani]